MQHHLKGCDIQRACNIAKHLGAKLIKTAEGWMFKIEVGFRDDRKLRDFQSTFYTPMSPVNKSKKPMLISGHVVHRMVYSATWTFTVGADVEEILRTEMGYKDQPVG